MRRACLVFIAVFAAFVFQQWRTESYAADFDATGGDEAAHFVTGLMIRDYAVNAIGTSPLQFAERFYLSYPKVAFGIWPPLFHLVEGLWFVLLGPSRLTALLLMAALTAVLALVLHRECERRFGVRWAAAATVAFVALPLTSGVVMFFGSDPLVSLLMFSAALAWSRFLVSESSSDAAWFGVLAGLALLTKYNAFALALLPPVTVALTGRWSLLRQRVFWLPLPVVAVLAGPWYLLSWNMVRYAAEMGPAGSSRAEALAGNLTVLYEALGAALLAVVLLGAGGALLRSRGARGVESAMVSLIVSLLVFHSFLYPFTQERYLLPLMPAALILATGWFSSRMTAAAGTARWQPAVAGLAALGFLVASVVTTPKPERGLAEFARAIKSTKGAAGTGQQQRLLVSSSGGGEGAFIAEVALRESRPDSIVFRSSKVFARSTWMNAEYSLVCSTPEEVEAHLDGLRIDRIVIDHDTRPQKPHQVQLSWAVLGNPARWQLERTLLRTSPNGRDRHIRLYRRAAPFRQAERAIEMDMRFTLGRRLKLTSSSSTAPSDGSSMRNQTLAP